jgi:DNA-binding NarL/FixJ family response regulator
VTGPAGPVRVFVCDDQAELRKSLSIVLDQLPGFEVVGEAEDGASCLAGLKELDADVLILDLAMPGGGPSLASSAREIEPLLQIIVFTAHRDADREAQMRLAGANEYVVKTGRVQPLRDALNRAAIANSLGGSPRSLDSVPPTRAGTVPLALER